MSTETRFELPAGIKVEATRISVDIGKAIDVISSAESLDYSRAIRGEDGISLIRHVAVCGCCKAQFPAYGKNSRIDDAFLPIHSSSEKKEIIREWKDEQLSLFEPIFKTVELNVPLAPGDQYVCPECFCKQAVTDSSRTVIIREDSGRLCIISQILNMAELIGELQSFKSPVVHFCAFPMTESLEFNISRGKVVYSISDVQGNTCFIRDITEAHYPLGDSIMQYIVSLNRDTSELVLRFFRKFWAADELPFSGCECDIYSLIQMTRFVGYGRSFYAFIPYELGTSKISSGFAQKASMLHRADNAELMYESSALPNIKSVRRIFFMNPGLLFYIDEAASLWGTIKNCDLFCSVISSPYIASILGAIHNYPKLLDFYADYVSQLSAKSLCSRLINCPHALNDCGLRYCSLDDRFKSSAIKSTDAALKSKLPPFAGFWHDNDFFYSGDSVLSPIPCFSYPMHSVDSFGQSCCIKGYRFMWLRSKNDYFTCGRALHNCLVSWTPYKSPVVGIKKGDRFVGAVELDRDRLIQAYSARNAPISNDPDLYSAYMDWLEFSKIRDSLPPYLDDDRLFLH